MSATDYTPIACAFHDRLESWSVRRQSVVVVWRDGDAERSATTEIADVFAADSADWVRLGTGARVRADALVSVGGVEVSSSC